MPKWLDNYIFGDLKAAYCPSYSDMTNVDDNNEKTLNYLGTYFPRSYAESHSIFNEYFKSNLADYANKEELSIFDFCSGTGGEIVGLLASLGSYLPHLKKVRIVVLDGNHHALRLYEKILDKLRGTVHFRIENQTAPLMIDDFYDLSTLDSVMLERFDIIVSFKAVCEFVTKHQFEKQNPYEHIAKFLLPKLKEEGVLLLEDVTTYNDTSQEWLPIMMDRGLKAANCNVLIRNKDYNQTYFITHSRKSNDKSKVAWRMVKKQ